MGLSLAVVAAVLLAYTAFVVRRRKERARAAARDKQRELWHRRQRDTEVPRAASYEAGDGHRHHYAMHRLSAVPSVEVSNESTSVYNLGRLSFEGSETSVFPGGGVLQRVKTPQQHHSRPSAVPPVSCQPPPGAMPSHRAAVNRG